MVMFYLPVAIIFIVDLTTPEIVIHPALPIFIYKIKMFTYFAFLFIDSDFVVLMLGLIAIVFLMPHVANL